MCRFLLALSILALGITCYGADTAKRKRLVPEFVASTGETKSFSGPHILINVSLEKTDGHQIVKFELINKESFKIGLFEFDFETLGHKGRIEFNTVEKGKSAVKAFKISSTYDPKLQEFTLFDSDANERFSRVIVQFLKPAAKQK